MDVIGNIVAVGDNVTEWKEGDRVAALVQTGGNARYAVISSKSLVPVPRSLDTAEAVCMISIYMTAYQSLKMVVGKDRTLKGKQVLVVGALGPTGQALIQMAKRSGADSIFATAPEKMHRYVKMVMGAKPLPMEPAEWLPEVQGKMDVVLDGVCQDGFDSSRAALSEQGTLVCIGMSSVMNAESMGFLGAPLSARWAQTKASYFMSRTHFYDVLTSFQNDPKKFKTDLEHVFQLLRQRDIKPHVGKRVSLAEVAEAHVYLELGKSRGAIVCMPWKRRIPGTGVKAGKYGIRRGQHGRRPRLKKERIECMTFNGIVHNCVIHVQPHL
jgi:NADPH:quinone reductase-like Zn-dependent oxidoreductase